MNEAMRRLGVIMRACPQCGEQFNASRTRFWITVLNPHGRICADARTEAPFCSRDCAEHTAKALKEEANNDILWTFHVSEDNEPIT